MPKRFASAASKATYRAKREAGKCVANGCRKNGKLGRSMCSKHEKMNRAYLREKRKRRLLFKLGKISKETYEARVCFLCKMPGHSSRSCKKTEDTVT